MASCSSSACGRNSCAFAVTAFPSQIVKVADAGRYPHRRDAPSPGTVIKLLVPEGTEIPGGTAHLHFDPAHTQVYDDGWMVT